MAFPNDVASPSKKPQPIPWTHQETVNLIRAYQEKWYSLKRGPLRSAQWEEVAVVVAARCGYDFNHPSKSALQCRHKMEKLRQRHRSQKQRSSSSSATANQAWPYSSLMDDLERGPFPISARPLVSLGPFDYDNENEDEDDYGTQKEQKEKNYTKSKSINYILNQKPKRSMYEGFSRKHVSYDDHVDDSSDDDDDVDVVDDVGVVVNGSKLIPGITAELREFAERFIGMENLKMKMMKETQRCRLEMEKKRIQMILESQRRIVDSIERAFGSSKRIKVTEQI